MTSSVWPKRFLIAGVLLIIVGSTVLYSGWGGLEKAMDPGENHVAVVDAGQSMDVNLTKGHVYLAYRMDSSKADCTITEVKTGAEIGRNSPGWLQGDRIGADEKIYEIVGTYTAEASGLHEIHNLANESRFWLVDEQQIEGDEKTMLLLQISCMSLLCGACLLPVGGTLWLTSRRRTDTAGIVLQTAGGVQIPITPGSGEQQQRVPTTDEVWASQRSGEPLDLSIDVELVSPDVPPPFADRPDGTAARTRVNDEIDAVEEALSEPTSEEEGAEESGLGWKSWDEG